GVGVGLGAQILLIPLLYLPLQHVVPNLTNRLNQQARHLTGAFHGSDIAVIGVLTICIVPFVEELLFRGLFLRGSLRAFRGAGRVLGPVLSIVLTGVVFGLAHFEALETLGLAVFGALLALLAYRYKRLGPCVVAHATFNLVAIVSVAVVSGAR
ncbi:MAG: CPBP family intramembrane glutamic endopeptidase, partial [Acidimicrobiales bacterium]